ncbi:MAG: NTPase [Thaumarchaeota archaeon]|nr:NTPase [Nitrososphaerota archaeon]
MNEKRIWLITGEPASGKSTALSRILLEVRSAGFTVGGVLTREIRARGEREGFALIDVASEESEMLANMKGIVGPRIGKYRVNLNSLSGLGAKALQHAKNASDLVACDEVGPMELLSPEFRRAVRSSVLESNKPAISVVHKRYEDPLIVELKQSSETTEYEITFENRDLVPTEIAKDIISLLKTSESGSSEV